VRSRSVIGSGLALVALFVACSDRRIDDGVVGYTTAVEPLLRAQCVRCHAGVAPAGGWRADSYVGAIGCSADERPVTLPRDATAPLLAALGRPDHAAFTTADERALLASWVESGASRSGASFHGPAFADPRSPESHGAFLRSKRYQPMLDANDPDACGSCHDGTPRRTGIATAAPSAPACSSCHASSATQPLACGTCHGNGDRAYPPRDRCFFPGDPDEHAHAAHAAPSGSRSTGLPCSTCHPAPPAGLIAGTHGNGYVEIWFDGIVAGRDARFDPASATCTGTCHARGGAKPAPSWGDGPRSCNDCHASPPANHYAGPCTTCHHEANASGTALTNPVLHVNGRVDLGDGSGKCGACHGEGDDPWPKTGAHQAHAAPPNAAPVPCATCHDVPGAGSAHPTTNAGPPKVLLGLLAGRGGRRPVYDPATKTCSGTYCHEGSGGSETAPRWTDGPAARTCTSCHAAPPPPPHVQSATCSAAACHLGSVDGLTFTDAGRLEHVDGLITRGL
jgi:predicted CxxxxCH...CXXCH cytochrome family protein